MSAEEITTNSINDFIADYEKEEVQKETLDFSRVRRPISETIVEILLPPDNPEDLQLSNGAFCAPKVNGKHNKHIEYSNLDKGQLLSQDNDIAKLIIANTARPRVVLPELESWQTSKIVAWHSIEGNSIQWLSVVCVDRRGKISVFSFLYLVDHYAPNSRVIEMFLLIYFAYKIMAQLETTSLEGQGCVSLTLLSCGGQEPLKKHLVCLL